MQTKWPACCSSKASWLGRTGCAGSRLETLLLPLALAPLPSPLHAKRGEGAVYDDPRVTEFMKTGHVRFDDSGDEELVKTQTAPEVTFVLDSGILHAA